LLVRTPILLGKSTSPLPTFGSLLAEPYQTQ
jgi:hypothetical protein